MATQGNVTQRKRRGWPVFSQVMALGTGGQVRPEAANANAARGYRRRLARAGIKAACDAMVWVTGVCLAAWGTHDVPAGEIRMLPLSCSALVICATSVMAGMMAGLYRGRWRRGSLDEVRIADLLGRRPVRTDVAAIAGHFAGKRVLVTGAGGSIGSQLCRQLHKFGPAELIMLDRDESALHEVQLSLHGRALLDSDETVLADIR